LNKDSESEILKLEGFHQPVLPFVIQVLRRLDARSLHNAKSNFESYAEIRRCII